MKKRVFVMIFAAAAFPVFSLPVSLIGGGAFGAEWTVVNAHSQSGEKVRANSTGINYGIFASFDAKYAEGGLSFLMGGTYGNEGTMGQSSPMMPFCDTGENVLGISLIGKYPFEFSNFVVFPLVGMGFEVYLYRKPLYNNGRSGMYETLTGEELPASNFNNFRLRIGAGADYVLTGKFFVRGELFYDFKFIPSAADNKQMDSIGGVKEFIPGFSSGPVIKIGLGYKINPDWSEAVPDNEFEYYTD